MKISSFKEYSYYERYIDNDEGYFWQTKAGDKEAYYDTIKLLDILKIEYVEAIPVDGGYALFVKLEKGGKNEPSNK